MNTARAKADIATANTKEVVDFAETFRDLINEKINECRNGIHEFHNHIDKDRLLIEIRALEWAMGQISDLVNNKERKERK
ncbi:MAG: hypothetical protein ACJ72X_03625 [Nitrososphaeraceae archaeon]|jgi:hypothetical protein